MSTQRGFAKETLEEKVRRVVQEEIAVVSYDPRWPELFRREAEHLRGCLPRELLGRVEHWARRRFRDCLIAQPAVAAAYGELKRRRAAEHPNDRVAYTEGKAAFVVRVTALANAHDQRTEGGWPSLG